MKTVYDLNVIIIIRTSLFKNSEINFYVPKASLASIAVLQDNFDFYWRKIHFLFYCRFHMYIYIFFFGVVVTVRMCVYFINVYMYLS